MSTIRRTAAVFAATAAMGVSTFATATPAEAAVCGKKANVYCSMSHAKKIKGTVKYGTRGAQVKNLQLALTQMGFKVSATGYFGPQTLNAMQRYQDSRLVPRSRNLDARTLRALQSGAGNWAAKKGVKKAAPKRTVTSSITAPASSKGQRAVNFAYSQIGKPYRYGATGPSSYDCSGLTGAAWKAAGKSIPRTSHAQLRGLKRVSKSNLQPGDIVGFYGGGHVGIYVGNGYVIHAPRTGQNVKKVKMSTMGFYSAVRPA
ncbi:C40 family peptidase [Luteococcus sp. Sow4_B9]|uniref:C40 family peptidase n=1 Tax=Luteococcus sp. Sow4_B9 TaxID=3438792 RepID=UPI003F973D3F